jgi:hypothetical protein
MNDRRSLKRTHEDLAKDGSDLLFREDKKSYSVLEV